MVAVASSALYVTPAPRLVSVLVEPFSLLLFPGLVVAMIASGRSDFTAQSVVVCSLVIYAVLFFLLQRAAARTRRHSR
jgi:hypothetical protein